MKQEQDVIKRNIQRIQKEPLEIKNISGEIKIIKKSYKFKVEELCKKWEQTRDGQYERDENEKIILGKQYMID